MEVEKAIVLSLSEPRNYTQLFTEARQLRKEYGGSLSKDTFNKSLKNLQQGKIVARNDKDGREVIYTLKLDSVGIAGKNAVLMPQEDKKIERLENMIKSVESMYQKIDDGRKNKKRIKIKIIHAVQILIMNLISLIMAYQKNSFFLANWSTDTPATKERFYKQQDIFADHLKNLSAISMKLDKSMALTSILFLCEEINEQTKKAFEILTIDFEKNRKYF